jgi:flagellar protein FliO/FliZ
LFRVRVMLLFVWFTAMIASQTGAPVFAEQSPTVKQCLEHPEKCQEDKQPAESSGTGKPSSQAAAASPITVWDVFKLIFATLFVLLLIYGLLRLMNQRGRLLSSRGGLIENLGGTSVGTNRSVQVIKIGKRILVVGVGESVQLLQEIEDEKEIKELLSLHNQSLQQLLEPNAKIFQLWNRLIRKKESSPSGESSFRELFAKQMQEVARERQKLLKQIEQKGTTSDE